MTNPRRWPSSLVLAIGAVTLGVALLLVVQLPMDPNIEVTRSDSPFTDEGWSVLGARNVAVLGRWFTDEWQLAIAQLPFNVAVLAVFKAFGVGIIQARVVSVLASLVAVAVLGLLVARRFGVVSGAAASLALGMTPLFLFYGHLALLEPTVMGALVVGMAAVVASRERGVLRPGLAAGAAMAIALGTKPSAAAPILGIMAGALLAAGAERPQVVRRCAVAVAVMTGTALAWLGGVALLSISVVAALRPWPETGFLSAPDVLAARAWEYVTGGNDNATQLLGVLLGGALLGLLVLRLGRTRLDPGQRLLIGAAAGWAIAGLAVLLVAGYRPNRYLVPLLPALAVLMGVGAGRLLTARPRTRLSGGLLGTALLIAIVWPGAANLQRWFAIATYRLPEIQRELAAILPSGAVVQGWFAPTLAMRAPVTTIIAQGEVNRGDTYERLGVRWLLLERRGEPVDWIEDHMDAWADRESMGCWNWQRGETCLHRLP